jgi:hypothetical protein
MVLLSKACAGMPDVLLLFHACCSLPGMQCMQAYGHHSSAAKLAVAAALAASQLRCEIPMRLTLYTACN